MAARQGGGLQGGGLEGAAEPVDRPGPAALRRRAFGLVASGDSIMITGGQRKSGLHDRALIHDYASTLTVSRLQMCGRTYLQVHFPILIKIFNCSLDIF